MSIHAVGSASSQIQTTQVSAGALKAAEADGDGRKGTAALNDGDAAAQQAARQVTHTPGGVNVKA